MSSTAHGIALKKKFGQHFLRDSSSVDGMIDSVVLTKESSVFEIGCGDGFLTRRILQEPIKQLWVFEIDSEWANYVSNSIKDKRMVMHQLNILDLDFSLLKSDAPWTLLANLPYQITFPILHLLVEHRELLHEGVIMVQDEVAQKILKTGGRGYGFISLYFQHFFSWKSIKRIPPSAFVPPPKVYSRLLYFKPRIDLRPIKDEQEFWKFIKACFKQPRRTLRNNLQQTHYPLEKLDQQVLSLRAGQLSFDNLLAVWEKILSLN